MSWSMPNQAQAQWNQSGMGSQAMNSGAYTPEQWAVMQQQNWQQWTQWQQQYSQWQSQYGDQYAEQLQAIKSMGGMPPLPPTGAAPPPPPDKPPPPPPPHENNQPLFHKEQPSSTPLPSQQRNSTNYPNKNSVTGNNQWSYNADSQPAVNAEALKKLAEEERLFDIQFQKWEEEIDKWRKENVDHPDKQAYKDYEAKFEACRKQLLERRQQMKAKRDLLNNPSQANNTGNTPVVPPPLPPPKPTQHNNSFSTNKQSHNTQNNSYERQFETVQSSNNINKNVEPQDRYESYHQNNMNDNNYHSKSHTQGSFKQTNKQDSSFLPSASSGKGIPGLDLVPDSHKKSDVIDITDDHSENQGQAPNYSISMGINNILGDEKIMNILSMVRGIQPQDSDTSKAPQNTFNTNKNQHPPQNNQGNRNLNFSQPQQFNNRQGHPPMQNQQNQNQDMNSQYQQGGINHNRQEHDDYYEQNGSGQYGGPNPNLRWQNMRPGGPGGVGYHQGGSLVRQGGSGMQKADPGVRQGMPVMHQGGPGVRQGRPGMQQGGPRHAGTPNMQQGGPYMQHGSPNMQQRGPGMQQGGPSMQQGGTAMHQGGPGMQQEGHNVQQKSPVMQQGSPSMQQQAPSLFQNRISSPMLPNTQDRPPLQDMSSQQNTGAGGQQRPPPPLPNKKWVEDPLFTPSIVVEYEHKSLRLKAREFIEPVHTFDYNHISKDSEYKKKNFGHEVGELFTRKPRRPEREYAEDRFGKDLFQRDYERRGSRDEFRDMREHRDVRESRDLRESRAMRELWEPRDMKEPRDSRESWDMRELRDSRDIREPRDILDLRDVRDSPRDTKDSPHESRDLREPRYRDNLNSRDRSRDEPYERRRDDRREDDRRRDDRYRRDDRDRDYNRNGRREEIKDVRRDEARNRSIENDSRKRGLSHENETSNPKKAKDISDMPNPLVMIDDLLEPPGRDMRPEKIVIILRGLPGSGKSYLAKLIRDREAEHGGTARIMSIDDYFMQEGEIEEKDPATGKIVKKPSLKYEYDASSEDSYMNSLKRAFKRSVTDGYFSFLIFDAPNPSLSSYSDVWNFARQNGFQVYVCTLDSSDIHMIHKRNIHNRKLEDLEVLATKFFPTPARHIQLDVTSLLQNAAITEVQMEDADDEIVMEDVHEPEVESVFTSKWEKMDDANKLARLDGTSRPLRPSQLSIEDYLQLDDWTPNKTKPGKKSVRWADIEERRQQEKIRAIGFVVGQTDWNRMTDPTMGSSALTQTKYIERVNKRH